MDEVRRRFYAFALRDEVPVPVEGWSVLLHPESCRDAEERLVCAGEGCMAAAECRMFATEGRSGALADAFADLASAVSGLVGSETPAPGSLGDVHLPVLRTVAVVGSPIGGRGDADHFDECFQFLADNVKALLQATGSLATPLSRQRAWPVYLVVDEDSDGQREVSGVTLMDDVHLGGHRASANETSTAHSLLLAAWQGNPGEMYRDFVLGARRAVRADGDYVEGVLKAAAAAEVLIKHVAWHLTWEAIEVLEQDPAPTAAVGPEVFAYKPAQLVGKILTTRLGGSWDSRSEHTPVGAWRQGLARLRNAVIHRGHRPSETEAQAALDALAALEKHMLDRLAARTATYPRTALRFLGKDGLERRQQFGPARATFEHESLGRLLEEYRHWVEVSEKNQGEE